VGGIGSPDADAAVNLFAVTAIVDGTVAAAIGAVGCVAVVGKGSFRVVDVVVETVDAAGPRLKWCVRPSGFAAKAAMAPTTSSVTATASTARSRP
jgi:hypothetical protein